MKRYLRDLLGALRGERTMDRAEHFRILDVKVAVINRLVADLLAAQDERDEIRTRYETLLAECTRHRHATWEITHR